MSGLRRGPMRSALRPLVALAAVIAGLAPVSAHAADTGLWTFHHGVAVRYGTFKLDDTYLAQVFGAKNDEVKVQYALGWRLVEGQLSAGFGQDIGFLQTADGAASDEHDMFTLWPLEAGLTARLDVFDEQWVVPTVALGGDYWIWRENWYVPEGSGADSARTGGKLGWHWAAGAMLRLDAFDRKAASELEASAGIQDTFVVAEYRRTSMPTGAKELQFSGWEITGGLRFDF